MALVDHLDLEYWADTTAELTPPAAFMPWHTMRTLRGARASEPGTPTGETAASERTRHIARSVRPCHQEARRGVRARTAGRRAVSPPGCPSLTVIQRWRVVNDDPGGDPAVTGHSLHLSPRGLPSRIEDPRDPDDTQRGRSRCSRQRWQCVRIRHLAAVWVAVAGIANGAGSPLITARRQPAALFAWWPAAAHRLRCAEGVDLRAGRGRWRPSLGVLVVARR